MAIKHEEIDWEKKSWDAGWLHLQFMSNRKEELRMAAYSINPCDRGSVMNNSTITQRPKWHFTLVAWEKDNATVGASLLRRDTRAH